MRRWSWILLAAVFIAAGFAYAYRWDIRDAWSAWSAPKLPAAVRYAPAPSGTDALAEQPSPVEGGAATSQHYVLISSPPSAPKKIDPLEDKGPLPDEVNLDVPFTTQAPYQNWDLPYQEACEEAAALMVDAFYRGMTGKIAPEDAKKSLDAIVAYEMKTLGYYKDTPAVDAVKFIKGYFGYADVRLVPLKSLDQVKRAVANGYPVIIPASGKLLQNPNYRNGGPPFHMLVVKGYTKSRIITNDAGTRRGADYTYTNVVLWNAIHDWNGGDVMNGGKVMIIVMPNK